MPALRPLMLSQRQGFDRRWFAPNLQAVYVPSQPEQVVECVGAALASHGKAVKIASGLGSHARGDVDRALWLYFLANFRGSGRNLVAIKRRWDPENYFHHAQSLPVE